MAAPAPTSSGGSRRKLTGLWERRARRQGVAALAAVALLAACGGGDEVAFDTRSVTPAEARGVAVGDEAPLATSAGGLLPGAPAPAGGGPAGGGPAAGETGSSGDAGPADGAPRGGVIKLGTVLPLQGGQRDFGEPILRTTQAFVDEVNARGGVNGMRLQLVAYNACLLCQDEALQATRRLVEQDGVFAIVNTYVMVIAFQPVVPYLVSKGVPLIQGAAENQVSDALSPINFATLPTGAFYGKFIPAMVIRYARVKRIGIVYLSVPSEAEGIPELKAEFERQGVEVVDEASVEAAEEAVTNMDAIVTRLRLAGAEGVVATNPVLLIYGRLAARRQGWDAQWVGPAAWSRLVEESCGATCDDLVLTDTGGMSFVDRDTPQMREFRETMARRYPGGELTGHTLGAWVGMQLTAEVLARTGPDRAAFLAQLEQTRGLDLGTTSPLVFGPDRHLGGTTSILLRLKGGRYVRVSDPLNFGELRP